MTATPPKPSFAGRRLPMDECFWRWGPSDFDEDEFRKLAAMVVDFARSVGLHQAQDDDLLILVIAAYRAGKAHAQPAPVRGYVS